MVYVHMIVFFGGEDEVGGLKLPARRRPPVIQLVAGIARQVRTPDTVGDINQTRAVYTVAGASAPVIFIAKKLPRGFQYAFAQAGGVGFYRQEVKVLLAYQRRVASGQENAREGAFLPAEYFNPRAYGKLRGAAFFKSGLFISDNGVRFERVAESGQFSFYPAGIRGGHCLFFSVSAVLLKRVYLQPRPVRA